MYRAKKGCAKGAVTVDRPGREQILKSVNRERTARLEKRAVLYGDRSDGSGMMN